MPLPFFADKHREVAGAAADTASPRAGSAAAPATAAPAPGAAAPAAAPVDLPRAEAAVREFLLAIGEDPDRPGLEETPARVARAAQELFAGMREDPAAHLKKQFLEPEAHGLVVVRDIAFASMCEHHILPFYGVAHVCYLPADGRITGLSKLARVVAGYAARLQVQERLGEQIASAIMRELSPQGVLVMLEAEHTCMSMRGIRARGATTRTCATAGCLASEPYYAQALALIGR